MKRVLRLCLILMSAVLVFGVLGFKTYQLAKPKVTVGATATPHAVVLQHIKADFEKETGYELQIAVMSSVATANVAMYYNSLDASYIQHRVSLEKFNTDRGQNFVELAGVHIEPFGLYSQRTKKIEEIPNNTEIIMPNSVANQGRALVLLEASGILKFKDGTNVSKLSLQTYKDALVDNPKNLTFKAIDPGLLVGAYNGNDKPFVFINTNYALQAKLSPTRDAIVHEDPQKSKPYVNILVTRVENQDRPELKVLARMLESKEVAQFIDERFDHEIVAVNL